MNRFALITLSLALPALVRAQTPSSYEASIQAHRDSIHAAFLDPATSPMQPSEVAAFPGLDYYAVDPAYRVTARFERIEDRKPIKIGTSDGDMRDYRRFGTLHFELEGKPATLTAFQSVIPPEDPAYADHLAVPFKDTTSGETTYGAGRYLDLRIPEDDAVVLDFNKAYAPYCAYSASYSCILPPPENHLNLAVEAGVKKYEAWQSVVSEEGGYSIAFPGTPQDQEQENDESGLPVSMKILEEEGHAYIVIHLAGAVNFDTLSASDLAVFYDLSQQRGAQNVGGTVGRVQGIELEGVPGRQFEINIPSQSVFGRWRMFGAGTTLYMFAVAAEGRQPTGPDADRFLNSFRLLEGGATPRLQRLLDEAGYQYVLDDDGDYQLLFTTTDDRDHLVWISTYAPELILVPSYEVWALVGQNMTGLPAGLAEELLRLSGDLPGLSAQLFGGKDGQPLHVALSVVVEQDVSTETLRLVAATLALKADALEARFLGTDDL